MISNSVMNFLMETSVLSFIFPVVILLAWRMRTRKNLLPALAGVLVFIVFAKLLEAIPFALFVGTKNPISSVVISSEILYALYQGISAAIFEETGRYLVFRYFLSKYEDRQTAITYGIGHGGIECMIIIGFTNIQYYIAATMLNQKNIVENDAIKTMVKQLKNISSLDVVLDGMNGVLFYGLQIALSIIVFQAYRNQKLRRRLLCIAMGLHAASYLPNGLYQAGILPHIVDFILLLLIVGFAIVIASDIYRKMGINELHKKKEEQKKNPDVKNNNWAFASKKLTNIEEETKDN